MKEKESETEENMKKSRTANGKFGIQYFQQRNQKKKNKVLRLQCIHTQTDTSECVRVCVHVFQNELSNIMNRQAIPNNEIVIKTD